MRHQGQNMSDRPSSPRRALRGAWFAVCMVLVGAGGLWLASRRSPGPANSPTVSLPPAARPTAPTNAFVPAAGPALPATLEQALQTLRSGASAATNQQTLAELQRTLQAVPAAQATPAITRFLDGKSDAPTG